MVDGARREHEPLGDLAVLEALRDESEHLELAGCQAGRVLARRRRGPREARAAAGAPRQPGRRRAGRALRGPCRSLSSSDLGERPRRLVRAERAIHAAAAPGRARELQPVRLGDPVRRLVERARLPLPVRELAGEPEMALLERERIRGPAPPRRPLGVAASQAASARAAYTWPSRCRWPPGRASSSASSSASKAPGSPRRARTRPSAMRPVISLIGSGRTRARSRERRDLVPAPSVEMDEREPRCA